MKKEELYDTIEGIDEKFIDEAETVSIKKKSSKWIQWGTIAACLCLVAGVVAINSKEKTEDANHILAWNPSFTANQYFTYSDQEANNIETSESVIEPPYAESRYFSDERSLSLSQLLITVCPNTFSLTVPNALLLFTVCPNTFSLTVPNALLLFTVCPNTIILSLSNRFVLFTSSARCPA